MKTQFLFKICSRFIDVAICHIGVGADPAIFKSTKKVHWLDKRRYFHPIFVTDMNKLVNNYPKDKLAIRY